MISHGKHPKQHGLLTHYYQFLKKHWEMVHTENPIIWSVFEQILVESLLFICYQMVRTESTLIWSVFEQVPDGGPLLGICLQMVHVERPQIWSIFEQVIVGPLLRHYWQMVHTESTLI